MPAIAKCIVIGRAGLTCRTFRTDGDVLQEDWSGAIISGRWSVISGQPFKGVDVSDDFVFIPSFFVISLILCRPEAG